MPGNGAGVSANSAGKLRIPRIAAENEHLDNQAIRGKAYAECA